MNKVVEILVRLFCFLLSKRSQPDTAVDIETRSVQPVNNEMRSRSGDPPQAVNEDFRDVCDRSVAKFMNFAVFSALADSALLVLAVMSVDANLVFGVPTADIAPRDGVGFQGSRVRGCDDDFGIGVSFFVIAVCRVAAAVVDR